MIVLASKSASRRTMLGAAGVEFEVRPAAIDERGHQGRGTQHDREQADERDEEENGLPVRDAAHRDFATPAVASGPSSAGR